MPERLQPDELELWQLLEHEARSLGCNGDELLAFIEAMTPGYMRPRHLQPVVDLINRAKRGERVRACVSVPPRHGKTETILHGMAQWIAERPGDLLAYLSYNERRGQSQSARIRDIALRCGVDLRDDANTKGLWHTLDGGGLIAGGIRGTITGFGTRLLVIDDPIKDREEAESAVLRDANFDQFTGTLLTRLTPDGSVIVIHTRWHEDDLIGRLAQYEEVRWEVINLPALDPVSGSALWPELWNVETLDERRRLIGPYDWHSLFLGQPRPRSGKLFGEPARYSRADVLGARIVIFCDPAATAKTSADHSVICVLATKGIGVEQRADVLDVWRGQVEIPSLVGKLLDYQRHWGAAIHVEAVGAFKGIRQMIRSIDPNVRVIDTQPHGDKFVRALPAAAAWNDGRIRVPMLAPWLPPFLRVVQGFTGVSDAHDDDVDALSGAWNAARVITAGVARGAH